MYHREIRRGAVLVEGEGHNGTMASASLEGVENSLIVSIVTLQ